MVLSPIKGMKEDALCFQDRMFQKMVESALDCFGNDRITLFSMPGDVKIDLAVNVFGMRFLPELRPLKRPNVKDGASETSRKTAGLPALRASLVNEAR